MNSIKEKMVEIIKNQPDDSSYDEIIRELSFNRMIEKGLQDSDAGNVMSNEDMKKRINTWQK
jgi:predicted transcriptional regulator